MSSQLSKLTIEELRACRQAKHEAKDHHWEEEDRLFGEEVRWLAEEEEIRRQEEEAEQKWKEEEEWRERLEEAKKGVPKAEGIRKGKVRETESGGDRRKCRGNGEGATRL
jgi:hypothetical protein